MGSHHGQARCCAQLSHDPCIDLAGTVTASDSADYSAGDKVVLNGWDVGEMHWGGLAQKSRLQSDWLVPIPEAFDTKQAAAIGTAGYTAMLCVLALEEHGVTPENGPIWSLEHQVVLVAQLSQSLRN